jgi:hypothetical protein
VAKDDKKKYSPDAEMADILYRAAQRQPERIQAEQRAIERALRIAYQAGRRYGTDTTPGATKPTTRRKAFQADRVRRVLPGLDVGKNPSVSAVHRKIVAALNSESKRLGISNPSRDVVARVLAHG